MEFNNKPTKELSERIVLLKESHDQITSKIIELIDYLEKIENEYRFINNELNKRNKK